MATSTTGASAWTAIQLQTFLREAATLRLFPAMWLAANTGLRRGELLGLRWEDVEFDTAAPSINRGLDAVGYKLHETRGRTSTARRRVDLAPATIQVFAANRDCEVVRTSFPSDAQLVHAAHLFVSVTWGVR